MGNPVLHDLLEAPAGLAIPLVVDQVKKCLPHLPGRLGEQVPQQLPQLVVVGGLGGQGDIRAQAEFESEKADHFEEERVDGAQAESVRIAHGAGQKIAKPAWPGEVRCGFRRQFFRCGFIFGRFGEGTEKFGAKLACGLAGEGRGEDRLRLSPARQKADEAADQAVGLAGSGGGADHEMFAGPVHVRSSEISRRVPRSHPASPAGPDQA